MTRLIKNWQELSELEPNDKYKVIVDLKYCCGWIVPLCDEQIQGANRFKCNCPDEITNEHYYENHHYLSTHTFYGKTGTPHILQEYGWDVELDNWDKDVK